MKPASEHPFEIRDDWYAGKVPRNILVEAQACIETSRSFLRFRSEREQALIVRAGACLYNPTLDVGPQGQITIGENALISSAMIQCDGEVTIGALTMFAWNVVVMDCYRGCPGAEPAAVHIGSNVWLGFESCVLPGVTIGDGSVIGARSVVRDDIPPRCIAAGNPARVIRYFIAAD